MGSRFGCPDSVWKQVQIFWVSPAAQFRKLALAHGNMDTGDGARVDKKTAFKIFAKARELGVTSWNTAARYSNSSGNSERVVGVWLKANPDQRRNVVITTKIYGIMDGKTPNHRGVGRINIL